MTRDLVILVSCQNCKAALQGITSQFAKLGIRAITTDIFVHPGHDPGCVSDPVSILRSQQSRYLFAMIVCDHEGSGREGISATEIEADLESQLMASGWDGRSSAIVIQPELESWVWSDSPHVADILGWNSLTPTMREWLENAEFLRSGEIKPPRPKAAVEAVMQFCRRRRTSAIYSKLTEKVGFGRCQDRAFRKLCQTLGSWFPQR